MRSSPILKCSRERWVCAPQSFSAGTFTHPRLSRSTRVIVMIASMCSMTEACHEPFASNSMPTRHFATTGLEKKPGASFRFIDPRLNQAGGGQITVLVADIVRLAQTRRQHLVV